MNEVEAVEALAAVGLDARAVTAIEGGWASWTFDVDDRFIVRFPRTPAIAESTANELRLLPWLADQLSFDIPLPSHDGVWNGHPFFAYPKIAGRPLEATDLDSPTTIDELGVALTEFHAAPVKDAADRLGIASAWTAWRDFYEELWPSVKTVVLPTLEPDLAVRVGRAFEDFLATPFDFPMTLVHNDLGLEHILMSATTGRFSGIIDFECATIGDPAVDFVPLRAVHGDAVFEQVTTGRELGDRVDERMHFYRWMGGVHAIIHGVTEHDETILAEGLSELSKRIDAPIRGA